MMIEAISQYNTDIYPLPKSVDINSSINGKSENSLFIHIKKTYFKAKEMKALKCESSVLFSGV